MAAHKHPTAWLGVPPPLSRSPSPAGLSGAAAKEGKGNPNPGRRHRAATLLSCSRDPQWHSGSQERRLLPSKRRSCQQARPRLRQPRRVHRPLGRSCPRVQRHLLQQIPLPSWWGSTERPTSPWHEAIPLVGGIVNQCIMEVRRTWLLCQGWSEAGRGRWEHGQQRERDSWALNGDPSLYQPFCH